MLADADAFAALASFLAMAGSCPSPKSRLASSRASRASRRPARGVDAYRQHLLKAGEPIGEAPALRAIRHNPQLQPAAIGELDDSGAGLGRADFHIG